MEWGVSACGSDVMVGGFFNIAQTCAPQIATETIAAIVSVESGFRPLAIRINTGYPLADQPKSKAEAIETATVMIAEGQDLDLGLGGVNASQLSRLGLSISDAFDVCLNLKATARLLDGYYRVAVKAGAADGQAETFMLRAYYGQGDSTTGEMVGYDRRVLSERNRLAPQLEALTLKEGDTGPLPARENTGGASHGIEQAEKPVVSGEHDQEAVGRSPPAPAPQWDVFSSGRGTSVLVFSKDNPEISQ